MPPNADKPEGEGAQSRRGRRMALAEMGSEVSRGRRLNDLVSAMTVRSADITTFLRQFIMLIESGTPILKALKSLAERGPTATRGLVGDIARDVETGSPLWQAFEQQHRSFDTVFVSLVKASEASGTLVTVMRRVVTYRERRELLRKRVRGGMFYPVILLFACLGVVLFISQVVIPEFQEMFQKFGQEKLPAITRVFIGMSGFINQWWWACGLAFVGVIVLYKSWWVRKPLRRLAADRAKLRMPIVGPVLRKSAVVEMTRTLALMLRSGLSMMQTLELVRNTIHNRAVAQVIQRVSDSVERGEGLETPLRKAPGYIIPAVVTDMLVTGEESGRLGEIAEQIADTYEEEVNIAIGTLGEALQPILTVFIGVLVVLLMLAVFVPMIAMLDTLGSGGV